MCRRFKSGCRYPRCRGEYKSINSILFFIGFANSLVIPISGSVLSIWLAEVGMNKATIALFALLSIPFSLRIFFAPLVDYFSWPGCSLLQRKSWVLFALVGMMFSLFVMTLSDPSISLIPLVLGLLLLSLFSGCFYIAGLSYELESQEITSYSVGSAFILIGYRFGLLFGGAGALYGSVFFGWNYVLYGMMMLLMIGAIAIVLGPEPYKSKGVIADKKQKLAQYPSLFRGFIQEVIVEPTKDSFERSNWKFVLLLLLTFKLGDQLIHGMVGPFYLSLGFSKIDVANGSYNRRRCNRWISRKR